MATTTDREELSATHPLRQRILRAAEHLLAEGGPDAVATRSVAAAAGVQAPAIYRAFSDKQGLLDAVAKAGFERYLQAHDDQPHAGDALEDLRVGWDQHIGFALANPYLYALVYGDPSRHEDSPTAVAAAQVVAEKVHRLAAAGRLRTSEERATQLLLAAGCGTALTLIGTPEHRRDTSLSPTAREACIAAVTTESATEVAHGRVGAAAALRADLAAAQELSHGERVLLREWLDRIVHQGTA